MFEGYRAQVDWPGAHAQRELAAAYPGARIELSVRPEAAWWGSFSSIIGALRDAPERKIMPPHVDAILDAAFEMTENQTFGSPVTDRGGALLRAYSRRIEDVRAAFPAETLLVFDVAEGWEPLCAFLGTPVPDVPFPRSNARDDFWRRFRGEPH